MKTWFILPIFGISAIIFLEYMALINDINGVALAIAVGAIASIATGSAIKLKKMIGK